jgi:hypothetical protein
VTEDREQQPLNEEERLLLESFRRCTPGRRRALLSIAYTSAVGPTCRTMPQPRADGACDRQERGQRSR